MARPSAVAERRREILEATCDVVAERGDFFSWAEYQRVRFDVPRFRPDGLLLAVTGDELVGLCQVSQRPGVVWAFVEMTGVRRDWRIRGVATALKLAAI